MKPLRSKHRLPSVSQLAFAGDPEAPVIPEDLPHSSAVRFGKLFRVAIGTFVALVAGSGWLI
jgi:hypothetical protein